MPMRNFLEFAGALSVTVALLWAQWNFFKWNGRRNQSKRDEKTGVTRLFDGEK